MQKVFNSIKIQNNTLWGILFISLLFRFYFLYITEVLISDSSVYAEISVNLLNSPNWYSLIYHQYTWLDKPHFAFWMTVIAFKLFGLSAFSYNFFGFVFGLIGMVYTYKMAKYLYNSSIGLLSAIIYLNTLQIMFAVQEIKLEAYLLGQIIPASYYWLKYSKNYKIKYLFLGAFFSGLAVMTKGFFFLVIIYSGVLFCLIFKYLSNSDKIYFHKWLMAILLTFLFSWPELIASYLQTADTNKPLEGLRWFLWDSGIGRFFGKGQTIDQNSHGIADYYNYFSYIVPFFFGFFPWSFLFIEKIIILFKHKEKSSYQDIFLFGSIVPTFILFSLSLHQNIYFLSILFPFSSIIIATILVQYYSSDMSRPWFKLAMTILAVTIIVCCILSNLLLFNAPLLVLSVIFLFISIIMIKMKSGLRTISFVTMVFALNIFVFYTISTKQNFFIRCDPGYNVGKTIGKTEHNRLYQYQIEFGGANLYTNNKSYLLIKFNELKTITAPCYLILSQSVFNESRVPLNKILDFTYIETFAYRNHPRPSAEQILFNQVQIENLVLIKVNKKIGL